MFHFMYLLLYKFIFELFSFECSFVSVVYIVCFSIMSQHKLWEQNIQQTTPQSVKAKMGNSAPKNHNIFLSHRPFPEAI